MYLYSCFYRDAPVPADPTRTTIHLQAVPSARLAEVRAAATPATAQDNSLDLGTPVATPAAVLGCASTAVAQGSGSFLVN